MIRFLHAADLHLGLRITRFEEGACKRISEARFEALDQLRAEAVKHQVHFVLLAGDIFDDHSVSKTIAERAFTLLEGKGMPCPAFIIPGNHDPLTPGGVWDRDPWQRAQPTKNIHLFREAAPFQVPDMPVVIFPCPLRNRNATYDPTAWIADHPRRAGESVIRIGLAHGSLDLFPNLPADDHLIRHDAAVHLGLDYLALGHWHKPFLHKASDSAVRTAYSGTHEPMRFPDAAPGQSTGWRSYAADGDAERFQDSGIGTALLVSIAEPGAAPEIEQLEVGRLRWVAEERDVTALGAGELIAQFANRDGRERTLLRLGLRGVLDPEKQQRLDSVLREIVSNRYCPGSSLDTDALLVQPDADQQDKIAGDGVLRRMLDRLRQEAQTTDVQAKRVADHALKLLYRVAWEEQKT